MARLKDKVTIAQLYHMEWYYVWWPWLTYKRVTQVCQHQLSFLYNLKKPKTSIHIFGTRYPERHIF